MAVTADRLFAQMMESPLDAHGDYFRVAFRAMGTRNHLTFRARSPAHAESFQRDALRWLARFEATYSTFLDDSLISRINRDAHRVPVPLDAETEQLFALCDWLNWKTRGILDPTVGPLLQLWNWNAPCPAVPAPDALEAARRCVGWRHVQRTPEGVRFTQPGVRIDLGGIGKEFAVDRVMQLAEQCAITDILIDLGHDVRVRGQPPEGGGWRIGLEHPDATGRCWGGVVLNDEALCGSGNYLRFFEVDGTRYGHILDPRSGWPVSNGCKAAWVIAPSATEAGALSTAALVLGADEGMRLIEETYAAAGCLWCGDNLYQTGRFADHVAKQEALRV